MPISKRYWFNNKYLLRHRTFFNYMLLILVFGLLSFLFSTEAKADCTVSGQNSGVYQYTSSNIASSAPITVTGTITCSPFIGTATNRRICMTASFNNRTSSVNGVSLPIQVSGQVGGAGSNTGLTSNSWIGPAITVSSNSVLSYNFTISVPAQANTLTAYPKGTYNASATIFWDMQTKTASCDKNTTSSFFNWDSGNMTINVSYTVPPFCQLNSTSAVNFGTIAGINPTVQYYDAVGAVNSTCNLGTSYTIQLGSGNNYDIANARRQMYNVAAKTYVPYFLYSDASRSIEWRPNESLSLDGLGISQSTPVYGRVFNSSSLATIAPGSYTDALIVTITY